MLKPINVIVIVVATALLLVFPLSIHACTCGDTFAGLQPCQAYWHADAVFTGSVADISIIPLDMGDGRTGYQQKLVRFSLEESRYGDDKKSAHADPQEVLVSTENQPIRLVIAKPGGRNISIQIAQIDGYRK